MAEMASQVAPGDPTDVGNVQAEEDARERLRLGQLDRLDDLRRGDLTVAFELGDLVDAQPVEVGHRAEQTEIPEPPDELLADALDVHRSAHPVDQRLQPAGRTGPVRASMHHLALGLHDLEATQRAIRRHAELVRAGSVLSSGTDDLRDDISGALHDHEIALTDPLAVDVLLVVQRRAGDRDAADLDGLEHCPRVEGTRAADADRNLQQPGSRRHGRPLVGARPAWALVERAKPLLLFERVDLDHDAVDLVVELLAPLLPAGDDG